MCIYMYRYREDATENKYIKIKITIVVMLWKAYLWQVLFKYGTFENKDIPSFQEGHVGSAAKSLQSCPTLSDPIDGSPPGSPVPGIFQARVLEWGVIAFSHVGSRRPK